jgi:predicted ArsR family transcriptional regulator
LSLREDVVLTETLEMREEGLSYTQMARRLGVSAMTARRHALAAEQLLHQHARDRRGRGGGS